MPARETEAIILRTYPLKEADKIVSFFSRSFGKTRGVAARARRMKSRFGTGLEPLSYVRLSYFERETRDLVNIDSCELIQSYFDAQADYGAAVACGFIAEVCEQLLPDHEPNDAMFRLLLLALENIRRTGAVWPALTYFDVWVVRLAGMLPAVERCVRCGLVLEPPDTAFYHPSAPGLHCSDCKPGSAWELRPESRALALEMLRTSLDQLPERQWTRETGSDLRRFLEQIIESHAERKLITRAQLESIE
jgi:DNA repair protein RecO (recombination protein O)